MLRHAELEAMVKQNSGNSSKPPSSDLGRKRKPAVEPSGHKRGGQPGHAGQSRELAPPEEVDVVVDQDPEVCENCGESLEQAPRLDAYLRQITETPWFKAFVKEFRLWLKACPKCGKTSRGRMPEGLPEGAFGPHLQARIELLSGRYRMTRRETRAPTTRASGGPELASKANDPAARWVGPERLPFTFETFEQKVKQRQDSFRPLHRLRPGCQGFRRSPSVHFQGPHIQVRRRVVGGLL